MFRTTNYTYDSSNRLSTIVYPEGNSVQYGYDARGNLTTQTAYPKPGSALGEAPITTSAEYPASCPNGGGCNLPTAMTDGNGNRTEYTYDGMRVTSVTRPAVNNIHPQTRYTYTPMIRRLRAPDGTYVTQPTGMPVLTRVSECRTLANCAGTADKSVTIIDYGQDNPNSEVVWMPMQVTRTEGDGYPSNTIVYTYTDRGDIASLDGPILGSPDITYFRYDAAHQLLGRIEPDVDGPTGVSLNRATRNTYSPDGLLLFEETGVVDGPSDAAWPGFTPRQLKATAYDAAGRVTMVVQAAAGVTQSVAQTNYDNRGRQFCVAIRMDRSAFPAVTAAGAIIGGLIPGDACLPDRPAPTAPTGSPRISTICRAGARRSAAAWEPRWSRPMPVTPIRPTAGRRR